MIDAGASTPAPEGEPVLDVLWTSGWDSTFRIAQLLLHGSLPVRPWYVRDPDRGSVATELRTMTALRRAFAADPRFDVARLSPLRVVERQDIAPDAEITAQFQRLRQTAHWGSQYEWLSRLAAMEGLRFELGLKADGIIRRFERLVVPIADGPSRFELDPAATDEELGDLALFRRFTFPLADLSKLDMRAIAERDGYAKILERTWFCHRPLVGGRPCGECAPCRQAKEDGFGRRIPAVHPTRRFATRVVRRLRRALPSAGRS